MYKKIKFCVIKDYMFLFWTFFRYNGLNKDPHTHAWKIMHEQIDIVNFHPKGSIIKPISGANTKLPTPLPAIVIPVAIPLFLSK